MTNTSASKLRNESIKTSVPNILSCRKMNSLTLLRKLLLWSCWKNSTLLNLFHYRWTLCITSLENNKLPLLEQSLFKFQSCMTALLKIPFHNGVFDNKQADILAKHGARQQQKEIPVCLVEKKVIIKYLCCKPKQLPSSVMVCTHWHLQTEDRHQ